MAENAELKTKCSTSHDEMLQVISDKVEVSSEGVKETEKRHDEWQN